MYVRIVLDCYSQKIVAWHTATTKMTPLALFQLNNALLNADCPRSPTLSARNCAESPSAPPDEQTFVMAIFEGTLLRHHARQINTS